MTTTDTGRPPTLDGCPVPGLRYVANWIAPETAARLLSTIDGETWASPLRRRVQHYGHRYDYGSRNVGSEPAPALPVWAGDLATRLLDEGFTDNPTEQVIVNEYLPGQGISAHIDSVAQFGPVVAAISLGSRCVMDFGHLDSPAKVSVPLEPNSLCVWPVTHDIAGGTRSPPERPTRGQVGAYPDNVEYR